MGRQVSRTALDEVFVFRLKALHSILAPLMYDSLKKRLATDKAFRQKYEEWVKKQGWRLDEERHKNIADQAAYILINKILFYKALERRKNLPPLTKKENVAELLEKLRECFEAALKIDYRAVFQRDPIYDEIPLTPEVAQRLNILIDEVSDYDLSKMKRDVIGTLYEKLIPKDERRTLGQFYTPPQIVELIVKMCISSPDDKVLDPGCGSGGFLVASYDYLLELKERTKIDDETHQELLSQIWGIDINKFPAHLATINLATQNLGTQSDFVNVIISDFFEIRESRQRILAPWSGITPDGEREIIKVPLFNAVMANPPYIRQEDISDKKKVREHLKRIGLSGMSARSDIYCYFYTHSSEFVRQGGRIGFVTSDRWLDVGYGKDLQEFFSNNFKIRTIITFDRQAFEDPLVGSCITILEKCDNRDERDRNVVTFLRIKQHMDLEKILQKAKDTYHPNFFEETGEYRITSIEQEVLMKEHKWNRFLYAPHLYFEILHNNRITQLEHVADVSCGVKTGANNFFCLKKEQVNEYGISRFVSPLLRGIGQVKYLQFCGDDTDWYVLDVHRLVDEILEGQEVTMFESEIESVKSGIRKRDFDTLASYISIGEKLGIDKRKSIRGRKIWFDLGKIESAPLVFSMFYWKDFFIPLISDDIKLINNFYLIIPKRDLDVDVLAGILNSDVTRLFVEMQGRIVFGIALNRIETALYELRELPVLDPRKLSENEKNRIGFAFRALLQGERDCSPSERSKLRKELNLAVLSALGMDKKLEELEESVELLLQRRIRGGAERKEVLVGPKVVKEGVLSSSELEEIVALLQLAKIGKLTEAQESALSRRAGKIVRDLAYEIIRLGHEPMSVNEAAQRILDIRDDVLSLAGYYEVIGKVMGGKTPPKQVIRNLLSVWRDQPEGIEKTVSRLLSGDGRFLQIESDLFGLKEWSPNELFQIYVQLVSKYRTTDYEKKETFKSEAIRLLESGEVDFPDKDGLIQTLRRL